MSAFQSSFILSCATLVLTYGKNKFAGKCSNGKVISGGFTHFLFYRVVTLTQNIFRKIFNISGRQRPGEI